MSNREWIVAEFCKGIDAERTMLNDIRSRADSPPEPALGLLYHQIAEADARHLLTVETIATRYGHTPSRAGGNGIGEALTRLKDRVSEMGTTPLERLGHDLAAKADAIHWETAWVQAFTAIGDSESARDLTAMLTEDMAHRDALQEGLNRLVRQGATSVAESEAAK